MPLRQSLVLKVCDPQAKLCSVHTTLVTLLLPSTSCPQQVVGEQQPLQRTRREQLAALPTLIPAVFHQPARNADDVMQDTLREVLQRHLLLRLHFVVPTDQVQDEDGWDWLAVPCHQAAELGFQGLLAPLKEGFLAENMRTETAQGFCNQSLTKPSV